MKKTDARFPLELLFDKHLDAIDRLIGACAYSFANWNTGEAYFSLKGLSLRAGIKDQRTVRTRLKNLEKHGWITVQARPGKRSLYTLRPLACSGGTIEEQDKRINKATNTTHTTHTRSKLTASNKLTSTCRARARKEDDYGRSEIEGVHAEASEQVQLVQDEKTGDQRRSEGRVGTDAWEVIGSLWRAGYTPRG